tara:strand:- start:692 stop:835 length:144 start_codon:yes stop_codon:yes gene_type:complete
MKRSLQSVKYSTITGSEIDPEYLLIVGYIRNLHTIIYYGEDIIEEES